METRLFSQTLIEPSDKPPSLTVTHGDFLYVGNPGNSRPGVNPARARFGNSPRLYVSPGGAATSLSIGTLRTQLWLRDLSPELSPIPWARQVVFRSFPKAIGESPCCRQTSSRFDAEKPVKEMVHGHDIPPHSGSGDSESPPPTLLWDNATGGHEPIRYRKRLFPVTFKKRSVSTITLRLEGDRNPRSVMRAQAVDCMLELVTTVIFFRIEP